MGKTSAGELERRTEDIFGLVVDGQPFKTIRQFMTERCAWDVDDRTLRRYIGRCTARFAKYAAVDMEKTRGKAVLRLERLYAAAMQKNKYRDALAIQQEIHRLHGLLAPTRAELSGPNGTPLSYSKEELAERFETIVREQAARLHPAAGE